MSEIFHEASKLFRTANESRAKEREKQPTAKHDENNTMGEIIRAGGAVVPGGRIRVCIFTFCKTTVVFVFMVCQETELQPLLVPRIRLRTGWFGENTYCWNSIIQFVKVIRKLFNDYYSKSEDPFVYYSDGSVEMSFADVLDRPVMEVLATNVERQNDGVFKLGYDEWESLVHERRKACFGGYFHEDEPSMFGLEFLQELLEYVFLCFGARFISVLAAKILTNLHREIKSESNPVSLNPWKLM